jgi:NAD(P)-dependent dehydrogenase (short-subunit alcohol dehydrogenase family)
MITFEFKNKVAVVTGAGSGIGQETAWLFAKSGAQVAGIDLNAELLNETAQKAGSSFKAYGLDVSNHAEALKVFSKINEEMGGIDVLVNNAGIAHIGKLGDTSETDFDKIYRVNVKGLYNCMYAALPHIERRGGGVILNMASIAAVNGIPDRFAYSMSKGAVVSMTYSVACDYLTKNIRCNCISPGRVHTPFVDNFLAKNYPGKEAEMFEKLSKTQPMGRMGTTKEIAELIAYLCSDAAAFITGCNYYIDGGFINIKP